MKSASILRRADGRAALSGKDVLPMAGEYRSEVLMDGISAFLRKHLPVVGNMPEATSTRGNRGAEATAKRLLGAPVPPRPARVLHRLPGTALLLRAQAGGTGHRQGALFGGHRLPCLRDLRSVQLRQLDLGYGMSLASNAGVASFQKKLPLAVQFRVKQMPVMVSDERDGDALRATRDDRRRSYTAPRLNRRPFDCKRCMIR